MNAPAEFKLPETIAGYKTFTLGEFTLARDEYFVTLTWPAKGRRQSHTMSADAFLRAMMRDVAWGFFYGLVNFDAVFGTRNLYGKVELFAGRYNEAIHGEVPSARIASITYSRFFATATFSYGFDFDATSKTFENT